MITSSNKYDGANTTIQKIIEKRYINTFIEKWLNVPSFGNWCLQYQYILEVHQSPSRSGHINSHCDVLSYQLFSKSLLKHKVPHSLVKVSLGGVTGMKKATKWKYWWQAWRWWHTPRSGVLDVAGIGALYLSHFCGFLLLSSPVMLEAWFR